LWQSIDVESVVILSVTGRGTRGEISTVGIGRAWDSSKPVVEKDKVLRHLIEDTDLIRSVVIDGLSCTGLVESLESDRLFRYKPRIFARKWFASTSASSG
jgi:hypothetical protein